MKQYLLWTILYVTLCNTDESSAYNPRLWNRPEQGGVHRPRVWNRRGQDDWWNVNNYENSPDSSSLDGDDSWNFYDSENNDKTDQTTSAIDSIYGYLLDYFYPNQEFDSQDSDPEPDISDTTTDAPKLATTTTILTSDDNSNLLSLLNRILQRYGVDGSSIASTQGEKEQNKQIEKSSRQMLPSEELHNQGVDEKEHGPPKQTGHPKIPHNPRSGDISKNTDIKADQKENIEKLMRLFQKIRKASRY